MQKTNNFCLHLLLTTFFLFQSSAQATTNNPACNEHLKQSFKSGVPIHLSQYPLHQELDSSTWYDLDVKKTILPLLHSEAMTTLGEARLNYWLSTPLLTKESITTRQQAWSILSADTDLTKNLEKELRKLEVIAKKTEQKIIQAMSNQLPDTAGEKYENPLHIYNGSFGFTFESILSVMAPLTVAAQFSTQTSGLAFMSAQMAGLSLMLKYKIRNSLSLFKQVTQAAHVLGPQLLTSSDPTLKQLGTVLSESSKWSAPMRNLQVYPSPLAIASDLSALSVVSLRVFNKCLENHRFELTTVMSALAELDALNAYGRLAKKEKYITPTILPETEEFKLTMTEGHHPYLLKARPQESVPNSISLTTGNNGTQIMFLTGPNARGKSTALRTLGLNLLLALSGGPVAADFFETTPTQILTNVRNADSLEDKESTFFAESRRMGTLYTKAKSHRHNLFIMDEIFLGTNQAHQVAAEEAVIRTIHENQWTALIASHKRELSDLEGAAGLEGFQNFHASDSDESNRRFRLEPGKSNRYNAFEVMQDAGMPEEIINRAMLILQKRSPKP